MNGTQIWNALSVEPQQVQTLDDDPEALWQQYFRRQNLLASIVRGEMHPDDLLDCMLEDGISPDDYLNEIDIALSEVI